MRNAILSVFDKTGIEEIATLLYDKGINIIASGGTYDYLVMKGFTCTKVEALKNYPSILGGRVKTLLPIIFGGILAKRNADQLSELDQYGIGTIDLVIVDLYPFEATVKNGEGESEIIEKIDIGGVSLIRGAAKNYQDVCIISNRCQYGELVEALKNDSIDINFRRKKAVEAFAETAHYDTKIYEYFNKGLEVPKTQFTLSERSRVALRYGENPHQQGIYFGEKDAMFKKLAGKDLSFNNLVDVDAAVHVMREFKDEKPTFAILKHTNTCGLATRETIRSAWDAALAGDPISAYGGILISNTEVDEDTAESIDTIFYEVLIAPSFSKDAQELLTRRSKRVLMVLNHYNFPKSSHKSILDGVLVQDTDLAENSPEQYNVVTKLAPSHEQKEDLLYANKIAKHLKSNTIVLVKKKQMLGMGCGQTSRVDACKQAIDKANQFGFDLNGAVMASDAFFPFPDCVALAYEAGIKAVIQPGGSIRDDDSIEYCNTNAISMVFTGVRHFKH